MTPQWTRPRTRSLVSCFARRCSSVQSSPGRTETTAGWSMPMGEKRIVKEASLVCLFQMLAVQFRGSCFGWWSLHFWTKILLNMTWCRKYISCDCNYCNDPSSESQKQHYVICRRTAVTISGFHPITRPIGHFIQKICIYDKDMMMDNFDNTSQFIDQ